ncbi:hypothetical protein BT63DRAFT_421752 [Microthyrium microscopicum]|uniref:Uncharacterized protein n=1 Tax=Microthyrium microscopicum TaxID=703497 RepID=A0A6A6UMX4_9PEZI|nr:hypothetical protein BT63DRAFT_421752 [Microthyrium microscopicum]
MAPLIQSWSSLFSRSAMPNAQSLSSITAFVKRSALSPLAHELSRRADTSVNYNPGQGAKDPNSFNKILFIVLFACIGSGMVLTSIYFFFVARNGGFVWKENDWDDYKSTVLRRKGPDGKTLSNATKSTKLGGGSVVPKWDDDRYTDVSGSTLSVDPEMGQVKNNRQSRQHYRNNQQDPVFKDYVDEKPAGVGGLNKPHEGSHYAPTSTARSEATAPLSKKEKKELDRREKDARKKAAKDQKEKEKEQKKKQNDKRDRSSAQPQPPKPAAQAAAPAPRAPASTTSFADYAYSDNNSYVAPNSAAYGVPQPSPSSAGGHSYYKDYRPQSTLRVVPEDRLSQRSSPSGANRHTATGGNARREGSPRKQHRDAPSDHGTSSYNGSDVGTKVYPCHIPGVSRGEPAPAPPSTIFQGGRDEVRPDESASQIGAQQAPRRGFRRGRGGI